MPRWIINILSEMNKIHLQPDTSDMSIPHGPSSSSKQTSKVFILCKTQIRDGDSQNP